MFRLDNYVDIARSLIDQPRSEKKHFSFIVQKNRIRAIGWNDKYKTSPLSFKFKYPYPNIHSEISAVRRFDGRPLELYNCILINIRLDKMGRVMYSKPCPNCIRMISSFSFKKIYFTTKSGKFDEF